ncbi:unnamed protein product [Linum trigynum]|uniref:Uncharacterized protein n=1 Tax=Linum trigynum TaxID=586398 RepID=A0AAV2GTF0_9ROSI
METAGAMNWESRLQMATTDLMNKGADSDSGKVGDFVLLRWNRCMERTTTMSPHPTMNREDRGGGDGKG